MAVETVISLETAVACLNALTARLDAGGDSGYIEVWSGQKPWNPETEPGDGEVLSIIILNDPAFSPAAGSIDDKWAEASVVVDPPLTDSQVITDGEATWFRAYSSDGIAVIDGTVGIVSADLIVNTVNLRAKSPFTITSWIIRLPTGEA